MTSAPDIRQVLVHPVVWPKLELWLASRGLVLARVPVEDDLPTYAMVVAEPGDAEKVLAAGIRDAARQAAGHSCGNCDGVDPGTCLTNPDRQAAGQTPTTEPEAEERQDHPAAELYVLLRKAGEDRDTAQELIYAHARMVTREHAALNGTAPVVEQPAAAQPADLLADCATEYHVPVPEGGGTILQVRRQALVHGMGWSVCTRAYGGGRAWTTEGWQDSISALSVDRLFCWADAATAVDEARRALAQADEETR
ncbi:hypothetical protein [Streptomyces sp. NPDC056543]|uniref:hypothetical protein n=1 Tax=unclassified Streptomyces TaxID=2593676 RepID=UPI0036C62DE7